MGWLKIVIDILGMVVPFVAHKGKKNYEQELEVARKTIDILSKDLSPEKKGQALEEAVGSLKAVKEFKKRVSKKIDKAKDRLYRKLF